MNNIVLITGGIKSGKSSFALDLSKYLYRKQKDKKNIAFIATAPIIDTEMQKRVLLHKNERDSFFTTYEEEIDVDLLLERIYQDHNIFILECVTTWLGNLFHKKENFIENYTERLLKKIVSLFADKKEQSSNNNIKSLYKRVGLKKNIKNLVKSKKLLIIVTNEVGLSVIPENKLARLYSETLGNLNKKLALYATEVYLSVSGLQVRIK